jgi:hypothetical protein
MPTDIAKYSIELFKQDGEGIEEILDRHDDLTTAWAIYRGFVKQYPGRSCFAIMLGSWPDAIGRSRDSSWPPDYSNISQATGGR